VTLAMAEQVAEVFTEVVAAAETAGLTMYFTATRHFYH
jgi:AICAR transformylase/IMP cyclohydrolase PurH